MHVEYLDQNGEKNSGDSSNSYGGPSAYPETVVPDTSCGDKCSDVEVLRRHCNGAKFDRAQYPLLGQAQWNKATNSRG